MLRLIIILLWISILGIGHSDPLELKFTTYLEKAIAEYTSEAASAVRVEDLSSKLTRKEQVGLMSKGDWGNVSDKQFRTLVDAIKRNRIKWKPSNMSALADEGSSLIVFVNKEGVALFGLIHENRWENNQYKVALVSGSIKKELSLDGAVTLAMFDRNRKPIRDVQYVVEIK